ncbi:RES family NAD+ phosphorylase [Desulfovibrio aminophilus]|nr:RES family NAD+ phosphorylase [Desulfovibrio aminophilus]MCM0754210.1 RES family NAD+ phosphorylase [Desulfovibrio aminophilus]
MRAPEITELSVKDTHRLIPAKYLDEDDSVLCRIAEDQKHLEDIFALDHATNDRLAGENNLLPGIGLDELVTNIPGFRIINASFCHAHPQGSRFNGPDRGAWYAGVESDTALAEVMFHREQQYLEIDWSEPDEVVYDDCLANFDTAFHDIRNSEEFKECLNPDSYVASQSLAAVLLDTGSAGIVYPSVRLRGGTCLVCFRPALVNNVRKGTRRTIKWDGKRLFA